MASLRLTLQRRGRLCRSAATIICLGLLACSGDTKTPVDASEDSGHDSAAMDGGMDAPIDSAVDSPADTGTVDSTVDSGTIEARELPFGLSGITDVIEGAGEVDWYYVDGTAGGWVSFLTRANAAADPDQLNSVLGLYDAEFERLGRNDDIVFPRSLGAFTTVDSEILYRFPTSGRYYLDVTDASGRGDAAFSYRVSAYLLDPAQYGLVEDAETGDDAASAVDTEFSPYPGHEPIFEVGYAIGTFRDATDTDVFRVTVGAGETLVAQLVPHGTTGHGATNPVGSMWITDGAGTTELGRIDPAPDPGTVTDPLSPVLAPGSYLLWVSHPGGTPADNDFYVIKMFLRRAS